MKQTKARIIKPHDDVSLKPSVPMAVRSTLPTGLQYRLEMVSPLSLRPSARNVRTHSKKQIRQLAAAIHKFKIITPVIIDDNRQIVAGHARVEAAKELQLTAIPVIRATHLSETEIQAFMLADNKIAANAGWDREKLAVELRELIELTPIDDFDLSTTGFEVAEIDSILSDFAAPVSALPEDDVPALPSDPATRRGDIWLMGKHRLMAGDARSLTDVDRLMGSAFAAAVFTDPPFNLRIKSIGSRGRTRHNEFAFASGEMSSPEYRAFLTQTIGNCVRVSQVGALHFICIDWRHVDDVIAVGRSLYGSMINLIVWVKNNGGMGSFYRSAHELICAFRVGEAPHKNNVELGRFGRSRTNVWHYPGVNSFGKDRAEALASHPTVKPVALVADAVLDCTAPGDVVLDLFAGSGTLFLATEKVGRIGYGLEYEPRYVDVAIKRWQRVTKRDAILGGDGRTFDEIAERRGGAETLTRRKPTNA